jgi:hypothetical protein
MALDDTLSSEGWCAHGQVIDKQQVHDLIDRLIAEQLPAAASHD